MAGNYSNRWPAAWVSLCALLVPFISVQPRNPALSGPAASMQTKLDAIERNGESQSPRAMTTQFSENEVNAYLNSGAVKIPAGVHNLRLVGDEGVVVGTARADFDEIKAGRRGSFNPLLALFSGTHDIQVSAHAVGHNRTGVVDVDSVEIDGTAVPRVAIDLFADHYLKPKYPGIGTHSTFQLPDQIDSATVGAHTLTVVQK
jgi:hypothetical protein